MAKQDQRILKFLTQNAERAPTITDMMTRLNISISDITASLNSLMAQGLVSKRTNSQGIECWFPSNGAPMPTAETAGAARAEEGRGAFDRRGSEARVLGGLNSPMPPEPSPLPPLQPTLPSLSSSAAFPASLTATSMPLSPPRSPARESTFLPASPVAGPAPQLVSPSPAAMAPTGPALEALPGVPTPPPGGYPPLAPVKSGIGFFAFSIGLIAATAASIYFSGRLLKRDLDAAKRDFVEKSVHDKSVASQAAFEASAKNHVKTLEADVKALKDQLAAMQAASDSLQAASKAEASKKDEPPRKSTRRRR